MGIHNDADSQIIFLATPGIHKPKEALNQFMVDQALSSISDGDLVVAMFSADELFGAGDRFIMERIQQSGVPFIGVLNKIDLVKPDRLQIARITSYNVCYTKLLRIYFDRRSILFGFDRFSIVGHFAYLYRHFVLPKHKSV